MQFLTKAVGLALTSPGTFGTTAMSESQFSLFTFLALFLQMKSLSQFSLLTSPALSSQMRSLKGSSTGALPAGGPEAALMGAPPIMGAPPAPAGLEGVPPIPPACIPPLPIPPPACIPPPIP